MTFVRSSGIWIRLGTLAIMSATCATTLAASGTLPTKAMWVADAMLFIFVGYFLFPGEKLARFGNAGSATLWALLVSLCAGMVFYFSTERLTPWPLLTGVFALTAFASGLTQFLRCAIPSMNAAPLVVTSLLLACLVPVIAGPGLERIYDATSAANSVISLSPVTYLSALIDYDYLRSEWFYENTPYGALRYEYPDPTTMTLGLFAATMLLTWTVQLVNQRRNSEHLRAAQTVILEDNRE